MFSVTVVVCWLVVREEHKRSYHFTEYFRAINTFASDPLGKL